MRNEEASASQKMVAQKSPTTSHKSIKVQYFKTEEKAELDGVVEYTDCISAVGFDSPNK